MKACTNLRCFMAGQCEHHDLYLRATRTDTQIIVDFEDLYKPDSEGNCLNYDFKSDLEKASSPKNIHNPDRQENNERQLTIRNLYPPWSGIDLFELEDNNGKIRYQQWELCKMINDVIEKLIDKKVFTIQIIETSTGRVAFTYKDR